MRRSRIHCIHRRKVSASLHVLWLIAVGVGSAVVGAVTAAGCASTASTNGAPSSVRPDTPAPPKPAVAPPTAASSATDPCATRLHELCGPLLFYYALNHRLPTRLGELQGLAGPDPAVSFDCPVSDKQYVYVPGGFTRGDEPGFVILHDAEPSHGGFRWAVVVEEPKGPKQPLIARVVAVPERLFLGRAADGDAAAADIDPEGLPEEGDSEPSPVDMIPE